MIFYLDTPGKPEYDKKGRAEGDGFYFLQYWFVSFMMDVAGERSLVVSKQCLYVMNPPLFGRSILNMLNKDDCA